MVQCILEIKDDIKEKGIQLRCGKVLADTNWHAWL